MNKLNVMMYEIKKAVVGKDEVIQKILLAMLARGHVLLEDIPGVGKTTLALAVSRCASLNYNRTQFTPDVLPSDVTGFSVYNKVSGKLEYQPGAALCNLFLADEINRTSSKTQAALLQVMEEGCITVDGQSHPVPKPYMVIATQNPFGSAGTQLLPESQLDRFLIRLTLGYPDTNHEVEILKRYQGTSPLEQVSPVVDASGITAMQQETDQVFLSDDVLRYIVLLTSETRKHPDIRSGASPRASLALARISRAKAYSLGRDYVLPQDVQDLFFDVIAHRILLAPDFHGEERDHIPLVLRQILKTVPKPSVV